MTRTTNLPAVQAQRMTSLEIAEVTGKPHTDVLKAIRKMEPAWAKVTQGNFSLSAYQDTTGRTLPCYALTKVECLYIATKFNDEARAKLVVRWYELEQERLKREGAMRMVWAMAKVENGDRYVTDADLEKVEKGYYKAFPQYGKTKS